MENKRLEVRDLSEEEKQELQHFLISVEVQMKSRGYDMDRETRGVMEACFLQNLRREPRLTI